MVLNVKPIVEDQKQEKEKIRRDCLLQGTSGETMVVMELLRIRPDQDMPRSDGK